MAMDNKNHIRGVRRLVVCGLLLAGLVATALGASVAGTPEKQWTGIGVRVAYADCDGVQGPPPDLDCLQTTPTPTPEPNR